MKVLIIDSEKKEIREGTAASLKEMQAIVDGYIERAFELPSGEEIFVNEEGLFRGYKTGFIILGSGRDPFVGNAFLTGPADRNGDNTPAVMTVEELKKLIKFIDILN